MRKSTRLLAIFLAVLMTVSVFPVSVFAADNVITAVDMSELVMETKFLYSGDMTDWSGGNHRNIEVTNPTFYKELTVSVNDGGYETLAGFTWEAPDDYDGSAVGEMFTFTAVAPVGYEFADDVAPEITVEIIEGTIIYNYISATSIVSTYTEPMALVLNGNDVYDATGCNKMGAAGNYMFAPGLLSTSYYDGENTTPGKDENGYSTNLTVKGSRAKVTVGGGLNTTLYGDTNLILDGATMSQTTYGGGMGRTANSKARVEGDTHVTVIDSTLTALYGGGYAGNAKKGQDVTVTGDAYIDVSGNTKITAGIYGGGNSDASTYTAPVEGTAYINIHDLEGDWEISTIARGNKSGTEASSLEVDLDDTSKQLLSENVIAGVSVSGKTDNNVTVRINGEEYEGMVADADLTGISDVVFKDDVLPTEFGGISGFTWDKDTQTVGMYQKFTLTAPEGYFFEDLSKTKEYTITVNAGLVEVTGVMLDENNVALDLGAEIELTATVEPENATDKTVVWSSSNNGVATVVNGLVTAVGVGTATITATASGYTDTCVVTVSQATVITEVDTEGLVTSTMFVYGSGVESVAEPKFYDTFSVTVDGIATELSGFKWKCDNYDATKTGTYSFTAVAPSGYTWFGGAQAPVITVEVVEASYNSSGGRVGITTASGKPLPMIFKPDNDGTYSIFDATGYNIIYKNYGIGGRYLAGAHSSSALKAAAGYKSSGDTSITVQDAVVTAVFGAGHSVEHTGDTYVYVNNSTVQLNTSAEWDGCVFGGGYYKAALHGDSHIYISDSTIGKAVYGGGANSYGTIEGDAYIDISGLVNIPEVNGGNQKSTAAAGTTYVTIHNLKEGSSIKKITRGTTSKLVVNITSSDDVKAESLLEIVENYTTDPNTTVYLDGKLVQKVSEIEMPAQQVYSVAKGTQADGIGLPTQLTATVNGQNSTINNVSWVCDNYDAATPGKYVFTPVVSDSADIAYDLTESNIEDISVVVRVLTGNPIQQITEFAPIDAISVSLKTTEEQLALPATVKATVNGQQMQVEVDRWICNMVYDGSVYGAEYTYTATISGEYSHSVAAPTVVVKITSAKIAEIYLPVTETIFPIGAVENPTFYDTLSVKLDNGTVVDASGFEWKVDGYNKNALGATCTATIVSAPANYEFAANLILPSIKITVARQKLDVYTLDTLAYLYGIPAVIDGTSTETYLYDITGCNKISPINIAGKSVALGGPANTAALATTYVEIRGGKIATLYGGSRNNGRVTESSYIYAFGGTIAAIYGGGTGGTSASTRAETRNAYIYVENATISKRICAAGYKGNIVEDSTIIVKNSTVNAIYGSSDYTKTIASVGGKTTMKLLDGANVKSVLGSGSVAPVNNVEMYLSKNASITSELDPTGNSYVKQRTKVFYETGFDLSKFHAEEENVDLYEGHFLADRETFVTDREIKIVRNAGLVRGNFYVDYGTSLEDIGLPTTFEGEINGELQTVSGLTYTSSKTYNGTVPGSYDFKLNVPDGYHLPFFTNKYAGTVKVIVTEADQSGTITSIQLNDPKHVFANGTAIENIGLPSAYTATVSGASKTVPVKNWTVKNENGSEVTYDRYTAGTYVFTPVFGSGYTVSAQLPTYTVTISEYRPDFVENTRYINGIPAVIESVDATTLIADKNGNYLGRAGTSTTVYGGSDEEIIESTDITFKSGTVGSLYGGSNYAEITGHINLVINGGSISSVMAGCNKAATDSINVVINGGTLSSVWSNYGGIIEKGINFEINGGTITNFYAGGRGAGYINGVEQAQEERLAESTVNDKGPIVVEQGELISAVVNVNGGTISNMYGGGYIADNDLYGSVKLYLNNGTAKTVYGGGYLEAATILGNVYIVVGDGFNCETIYANASGKIHGKAYVVVPDSFNRFDILGWNEEGDDSFDDTGSDMENEGSISEAETEVIVSGGYYRAGVPVRIMLSGSTQNVYARGIPIKIAAETTSSGGTDDDEEDVVSVVSTYIMYFDENYDETSETPEIFSYETYVDRNGNPLVLTGVWRRMNVSLTSSAVIYGGGRQGTTDIHPSTYVEFNGGNVAKIYGGGRNNTAGAANVVLDAQTAHSISGDVYGAGTNTASIVTNKAYVKVLNGSYNRIVAGGYEISSNSTQVDVLGGSINYLYMGGVDSNSVTGGTTTINLENCTVGSIYSGGVGDGTTTTGAAYININENVNITGSIYPKGSGLRPDGEKSGAVKTWAYVYLNDIDSSSSQFRKIKYTKSQAPYIYVNDVALGEMPDTSVATFETADKIVEVTTAEASDYRGNRSLVFLNGIPSVIAGDGNGNSYVYQAKTKDGTLNAYQKNEDGTFKYDENGERISNIVRDPVTGQAIKGPKLVDVNTLDCVVYGGANGKSVEDVYVEFHNGGGMWVFYGGSRGGNAGYDAQGNEVGLIELRQFDGGAFDLMYIGNVLGYDVGGDLTVKTKVTKSIFLGLGGGTRLGGYGGLYGERGSEEKFLSGYYNKAGQVVEYTDAVDGQHYEITGTWEDYNLDITKQDYDDYYASTNSYFNGEDNTDFLNSNYYVDPYDDHYTTYCLFAGANSGYVYLSTVTSTVYSPELNRTFGNTYLRQSAYRLKYDAELDRFVEDYSNPLMENAYIGAVYGSTSTGLNYNDLRCDIEGVVDSEIRPNGKRTLGGRNFGHVYVNLYESDTYHTLNNLVYNKVTDKSDSNVTINQNVYPRWSFTSAWALDVDPQMAQFAIDKGYITEVSNPKDVRISMLAAEDAAKLLNYYYTGSYDEYITAKNAPQTQGYKDVWDASNDKGKLVIRHFEQRKPAQDGAERFLTRSVTKFGDGQLITFPNGETMLIDNGQTESSNLIKNIRYILEQLEAQGMGDGNTIDYFVVTHFHTDHDTNSAAVLRAFNIKNVVVSPFNVPGGGRRTWLQVVDTMNNKRALEGKELIKEYKVKSGDQFIIGEGDEQVVIDVVNPGDHSYRTYTLEEAIRQVDKGSTSFANPCGIGLKFNFKGQTYFTAGDIAEDAELSMLRTYGKDYLDVDVMKLSHHGHATSNTWGFMSAINPEIVIQPSNSPHQAWTSAVVWGKNNNTGGYAEDVFNLGISGDVKVTMDGEKVTSVTQYKERAFERDTAQYNNLESEYTALLDRVEDTREALTVVADNATAPYGTAYIWNSHANYIDTQLKELSKRFYSGTMTIDMLEDYTEKLLDLEDYIDDATMYGGSDTTPDVEVPGTPGTDEGGETTTPGTSGGIIGDVGGGDAGSGIGGGAVPGGAVVGPSTDDGGDDDRRFIDVATTDWFNNAVNYVADNNYFRGVSENQFDPSGKMTRAMLVTVIGRMAKADTSEAVNNFTDVEDGSWYAGYVAWAAENGIVTGVGDSKFAPNDNVTREQIAAILMRYATYKGIDVSVSSTEKYDSMKDTDKVSEYAVEALKWATANGIINGAEGNINPRGNATRAEVAQMIMNFCNTFSI